MTDKIDGYWLNWNGTGVTRLVKKHHYLHRMPARVVLKATLNMDGGMTGTCGKPVMCLVLSRPQARWSDPDLLEVSRLVRTQDCNADFADLLSAVAERATYQQMSDLLIAYTNPRFEDYGHSFIRAEWEVGPKRKRSIDGVEIYTEGHWKYYPGRTCNSKWGTRSATKLRKKLSVLVRPHYDHGKIIYFAPLTKRGKEKAMNLKLIPPCAS